MKNEESDPGYGTPANRAAPAAQFNFSTGLRFAASLLLGAIALHLLWLGRLPPPTPAKGRGPLPEAKSQTADRAATGGAPERAAPEYGADREENLTPPHPGLLMPLPSPLETISYTGPSYLSPAALAKETAVDEAGCKAGDMFKCLRLGGRYIAGHGVERDAVRGFPLINRACAGGIAEACTMQGTLQLAGHGTAQDGPAAIALFDKACAAGDMYGCSMLGNNYLEGKYVPADIPRGLGLFRKACDGNLAQACSFLGMFYSEGRFTTRDLAAADLLYGRACDLQDRNSCQLRQQLAQIRKNRK